MYHLLGCYLDELVNIAINLIIRDRRRMLLKCTANNNIFDCLRIAQIYCNVNAIVVYLCNCYVPVGSSITWLVTNMRSHVSRSNSARFIIEAYLLPNTSYLVESIVQTTQYSIFLSYIKTEMMQVVGPIHLGIQRLVYPIPSISWLPMNWQWMSQSKCISIYDIGVVLQKLYGFSTTRVKVTNFTKV